MARPCALRPLLLLTRLRCLYIVSSSLADHAPCVRVHGSAVLNAFDRRLIHVRRWKRPARWSAATWRRLRSCWSWIPRRTARTRFSPRNREIIESRNLQHLVTLTTNKTSLTIRSRRAIIVRPGRVGCLLDAEYPVVHPFLHFCKGRPRMTRTSASMTIRSGLCPYVFRISYGQCLRVREPATIRVRGIIKWILGMYGIR